MNSNWNEISSVEELKVVDQTSQDQVAIIFKHSTSCSTSALVLSRLQRNWNDDEISSSNLFYLDLLSHRDVSNEIASKYAIQHQSPQVLVIRNGACIYSASHFEVDYDTIKNKVFEREDISSSVS